MKRMLLIGFYTLLPTIAVGAFCLLTASIERFPDLINSGPWMVMTGVCWYTGIILAQGSDE